MQYFDKAQRIDSSLQNCNCTRAHARYILNKLADQVYAAYELGELGAEAAIDEYNGVSEIMEKWEL